MKPYKSKFTEASKEHSGVGYVLEARDELAKEINKLLKQVNNVYLSEDDILDYPAKYKNIVAHFDSMQKEIMKLQDKLKMKVWA